MRHLGSRLLTAVFGVVILALLFATLWLWRERHALLERQAAGDRELAQVREQLRRVQAPPVPGEPAPIQAGGDADARRFSRYQAALDSRDAQITQLKRTVTGQTATIEQLQAQVTAVEDERKRLSASPDERYQKVEDECRARLDEMGQRLQTAQSDSRQAKVRIADLEATNTRLRGNQGEDAAHTIETARILTSIKELNRRRDASLRAIIRRYQDATGQLRGLNAVLDSTRDQNTNTASNSALMRIQNTISATEEDLRQLNDLNAQVDQLERKLEKK